MLEFSDLHQVREGLLGIRENKQFIFSRIIILMVATLPISDIGKVLQRVRSFSAVFNKGI